MNLDGFIISMGLLFLGLVIGYFYGRQKEYDRISNAFRSYGYSHEEIEEILDNHDEGI